MADTDERQLLAWSYGKLAHMTFNKQEDALQLDRIKLLLMDAEPHPELVKELADALCWYAGEAAALAKNMSTGAHTNAVLASITVLSLDAGKRAAAVLAKVPHA